MRKINCQNATKILTIIFVLCCLCAMTIAPDAFAEPAEIPEQSEEYEKGKALDDAKKYDEARKFFEAGTEKGDPWCMNELGMYYRGGFGGLEKDLARAFALRSKAAELNVPDANYYLGLDYLNGWFGVPKDPVKGKELTAKAVELGYDESVGKYFVIPKQSEEFMKGEMLNKEKKYDEARAFYESGAEKGDSWCMNMLGVYYIRGLGGLQKDEARGVALINKATGLNCPEAFNNLAIFYLNGEGVPQDSKKGIELLKRAVDLNYPYALNLLALCYLEGRHGVAENTKKGIELMTRAADLKDPSALYNLGVFYLSGQYVLQDTVKGRNLLTTAAVQDNPFVLKAIARMYLQGKDGLSEDTQSVLIWGLSKAAVYGVTVLTGVPANFIAEFLLKGAIRFALKETIISPAVETFWGRSGTLPHNIKMGIALLIRAAELDGPDELYDLGRKFLTGENGIPQDYGLGIELLKKAAEQDHLEALITLGEYYAHGGVVARDDQVALAYFKKAKDLGREDLGSAIQNLERHPDIIIAPKQLVQSYLKDKIDADTKYRGKVVRTGGDISEIGNDSRDKVYIRFIVSGSPSGSMRFFSDSDVQFFSNRGVQFFFDRENQGDVSALKVGDKVTIQGKVIGLIGEKVVLEHCWIVQ